jgi:hypothetical protein
VELQCIALVTSMSTVASPDCFEPKHEGVPLKPVTREGRAGSTFISCVAGVPPSMGAQDHEAEELCEMDVVNIMYDVCACVTLRFWF